MKISGITSIGFAPHVDNPKIATTFSPEIQPEAITKEPITFTLKDFGDWVDIIKETNKPRFNLVIKTKRTPRKKKKNLKKMGKYNSKRTYNINNAEVAVQP